MRRWAPVAWALLVLAAAPARGEVTQADLQLAARALSFMEKPLTGTVRLGVVYIPGDDQSLRDADAVVRVLGASLKAGSLVFKPAAVSIDQATSAPVDAFFLPDSLGSRARKILAATERKHVPCITLDIAQVRNGTCVLGVQVVPKVQIYVSRSAAASSGISFVAVFRMMVTEF